MMKDKAVFLIKRGLFLFTIAVVIFSAASFLFLLSKPSGKLLTIGFRGFDRIGESIYVDSDYHATDDEVSRIVGEALDRVESFFGEIRSDPAIILSDDYEKLGALGLVGQPAVTTTFTMIGKSYIVVAPDGFDIDIIAHELTHAEFHALAGDISCYPIWFDEGLATQNDYRAQYDYQQWLYLTDSGRNLPPIYELAEFDDFYTDDGERRHYNYVVAKHEVSEWLKNAGMSGLRELISRVSSGDSFTTVYYEMRY